MMPEGVARRWGPVGQAVWPLPGPPPRVAVEPCKVLIVAGSPEPSSPELVAALAAQSDYVIAADAGAVACHGASVRPDAFVGDADSAPPGIANWARSVASVCEDFPAEKDDTDLGLAIVRARAEAILRKRQLALTVTCAAGGRPDHALAVVGRLADAADAAPRQVEDTFECRVLAPHGAVSWELGGMARHGATFSAIALAPGTVASELGMRWELRHEPLALLGDRGVSNVITSDVAQVTCHQGILACFLTSS